MGDNNENTPVKPVVVNLSIDVTTVTKSSIKVHKDTKVLKTSKQKILCPEIRLVPDVQTWSLQAITLKMPIILVEWAASLQLRYVATFKGPYFVK